MTADRARPVLRLAAVGKRYGRSRWVVRNVDLEVGAGEVVSMSGANGAGKSTLLRLSVGACRPSEGEIVGPAAGTRWVPDRVAVHPRLPALAYVQHMGRLQGLAGRDALRRGESLLARLELAGGARSAMGTLSKGNAQKVVLAQAVLTLPALLVLDEPWSGLDAPARVVLAEIIGEIADAGGAVLFTDHGRGADDVAASSHYRIADGEVQPGGTSAGPAPAGSVAVYLEADPTRDPSTPDWTACPGVTRVERPAPGHVRLDVRPDGVDSVLATALAASWSVDRVDRGVR